MYYVGLDVHKKTISYRVKDGSGIVHAEGAISATRWDPDSWMETLPQPWTAAMEATIFTGWIYDHLKPHAAALKVARPLMLRAIAAAKKKNDRIDANKIADCLRCDFLPECESRQPRGGAEAGGPLHDSRSLDQISLLDCPGTSPFGTCYPVYNPANGERTWAARRNQNTNCRKKFESSSNVRQI